MRDSDFYDGDEPGCMCGADECSGGSPLEPLLEDDADGAGDACECSGCIGEDDLGDVFEAEPLGEPRTRVGFETGAVTADEVAALIRAAGGQVDEAALLPDGSGCMVGSFPLPADHWLTRPGENTPPGTMDDAPEDLKRELWDLVLPAAQHALRAATDNGRIIDLDPDALIQNLKLGLFGYRRDAFVTEQGRACGGDWGQEPTLEPREEPFARPVPTREDAVTLDFDMGDHSVCVRRLRRNLKPGQFALGRTVTCGTPPDAPVQAWRVSAVGEEFGEVVVHLEDPRKREADFAIASF